MFVLLLNVSVHFDATRSSFRTLQVTVYHPTLLMLHKSRFKSLGQKAYIGNTRNAYEILVGKSKKKI